MKYGLIIWMALGLVFFGCLGSTAFKPDVSYQLDRNSVDVSNGNISTYYVTATVTRNDNDPTPTVLTLEFKNKPDIYAVDSAGQRIESLNTKSLVGQGAKDTPQFKIFGRTNLATGTDTLDVDLDWNGTTLSTQTITVNVK